MMARFVAAQRPGYLRKAVLIAVAAIAVVIAWMAAAISGDGLVVKTYVLVDGVLKPDGGLFVKWNGNTLVYNHTQNAMRMMAPGNDRSAAASDRSTTVTRNGARWFTLTTAQDGTITISDPNGNPQQPIVTIPSHQAGPAKPETR
jgi:hypothetical protein